MSVVVIAVAYLAIGALLYVPFVVLGRGTDDRERLLAAVLPDPAAAPALLARVRAATARVHEMNQVLGRPDPHGLGVRLRVLRDRRLEELAAVEALIAALIAHAQLARFGAEEGDEQAELVGELLARIACLPE